MLGAALAPPDATAVAALGRTLPRRDFQILKAESLTNDGTALVVYALAVGVAVGGHYTALDVTGRVLLSYLGGVAVGAAVAGVADLVMRPLREAPAINLALLLVPFVAYLLAEQVEASGVLAVVVAGLIIAFHTNRLSTAASRRQTESAWPLGSYVLNGTLFVLIGLEVQAVARYLQPTDVARLLLTVVVVWLGLLVIRFAFITTSVMLIRLLDRRPSQRLRRRTYRSRVVSAVAGFRGAVSLAIALSVPVTMNDGQPLAAREEIIFVTAGVVVLTLLVQGPLLPVVVRWARLPQDDAGGELRLAEYAIAATAVAALPTVIATHGASEAVRARLAHDYQHQLHQASGEQDGGALDGAEVLPGAHQLPLEHDEEYTRLRLALMEHKREELNRLRHSGTIDDSVALRVQTRLDIEELRLTGIDPLD
ncbi:cation:proton antiporter [Rhodococcus sp. X156]|uniref:cation:proton antiporter domain-containing protein n=1 Tax=Rhodococcus sp. X156 TaxID=2499145 RepID=UPI0024085FC8|nr:cation:proton antiporter [Rhodococcus sp. X156]